MLQLGGEHDFVLETLEAHAGREMGRGRFHHDTTTERALLREKHATHATAAELAFYAICAGQRGLQRNLKMISKSSTFALSRA